MCIFGQMCVINLIILSLTFVAPMTPGRNSCLYNCIVLLHNMYILNMCSWSLDGSHLDSVSWHELSVPVLESAFQAEHLKQYVIATVYVM